jgi:hypothetical protein
MKRNNQSKIYHELFDKGSDASSVETVGFNEEAAGAGPFDADWALGAAEGSVGSVGSAPCLKVT